ncbi:MAG: type II toxin-antitoxin system RelE/ParE family toxin [Methylocystis sp.]|jgi:plasmid stabilization system protein ParE
MNVRFTRRAQSDLLEILSYLAEKSPQGAARVATALEAGISFVSENPRGGLRTEQASLYVKILPNCPYKIFYRFKADVIEVVHIRHSARRPWPAP